MPSYEDPGCLCKCCCPPCAVYQSQGCKCPEMCAACCFGWCYTMTCWDPKAGKPGAPPQNDEMER